MKTIHLLLAAIVAAATTSATSASPAIEHRPAELGLPDFAAPPRIDPPYWDGTCDHNRLLDIEEYGAWYQCVAIHVYYPIPREDGEAIYPQWIAVPKCQGNVDSPFKSCLPIGFDNVTIGVHRRHADGTITCDGYTMQGETDCIEACRTTPADCLPHQVFNENTCKCECDFGIDAAACYGRHTFNKESCVCECKQSEPCDSDLDIFDTELCRCVPFDFSHIELDFDMRTP